MNIFPPDNRYGVTPGIYGVPIDVNNIQIIYNTTLLAKAGWDVAKLPATWMSSCRARPCPEEGGYPGADKRVGRILVGTLFRG